MIHAVISDIHANKEALERVLADAAKNGAEDVICLGDVVGYGPLPQETLTLVRQNCRVVIAGNHDDAVSGRTDASSFIDLAGDAVKRHREALDADSLAWLKSLPYTAALGEAMFAHGDFVEPAKFYYIEDTADATANFNATEAQLLFVGHTHTPRIFLVGNSGTVYETEAQDFTLEKGKRYIVNPGSVGYPRESNGECHSSYVLYDDVERTITFRTLPFSVASVMQRGGTQRRIGKMVFALALVGAALLAAVAMFCFKGFTTNPAPNGETIVETVLVDRQDTLVIERKRLELPSGTKAFRANLELSKGSSPVLLKTVHLASDGSTIDTVTDTVKQKLTKKTKVRKGAVDIEFVLSKLNEGDEVAVASFNPAIEPEGKSR